MKRIIVTLCGLVLLASLACNAVESPNTSPRDWLMNAQANNRTSFTGTFVKYENGLVHIKMPDGYVRKYTAAQLCDRDLSYLQKQISEFPKIIKTPQGDVSGKLLVDLSVDDLALGQIKSWKNNGELGGAFHALRTPLTVEVLGGKKAVKFYFGPWAVPLEFQAMVADFYAPVDVVNGGPYTVATWIYNASPLGIDSTRESVLSWHAMDPDGDGTDIGYGQSGRYSVEKSGNGAYSGPLGSFGFPDKVFPAFNEWHHIVYVYTGSKDGKFLIYIDGHLAVEKDVSKKPSPNKTDKLLFLGCNWGTRPQTFFTGDIADFKLYSKALTESDVKALYGKPVMPRKVVPTEPAPKIPPAPDYYTPEFDGLVSEPYPKEIRQNGDYGKLMEGWGQPVIGRANTPDDLMALCAYTMAKTLWKRPDIVDVMEAMYVGARLDHVGEGFGPPWLGDTEFTTACYGQTRTFMNDPYFYWGGNIMVHEMGHQFHMWGGEIADPTFRQKLFNVFWQNKKDGKWSGDYGGLNMWEFMACAASAYCSDGGPEEAICRRESFRNYDPRMFYFLQDYWPGDMIVELLPAHGMHTDAKGNLTAWDNNGGLEYFGKFGLQKYERSVGTFTSIGSPKIGSFGGVTSVGFSGKDALMWDKFTKECLIGNKAWSVELWAYKSKPSGDETLVAWGPEDSGVRIKWGSIVHGGTAEKWSKLPAAGGWHHIVCTFRGGGLEDTSGDCKVFVDGKLNGTSKFKMNIPTGQRIIVGAEMNESDDTAQDGFVGALAHVRIYDYDLGDLQLAKHYDEENYYYSRENLAAKTLLVDLDAEMLSTCPSYQFRPLYPKSLGKEWVRAWANRGALAGKMSNDIASGSTSQPQHKDIDGVTSVAFKGKDRMVSSFKPSLQTINSPLTVEAWVFRSEADKGGTILQWGQLGISGKMVQPKQWHLVTLVVDRNKCQLYVDGNPKSALKGVSIPRSSDRLHFGAKWNGKAWSNYFTGGIAQVRVQSGSLTATEIAKNFSSSDLQLASHPSPAVDEKVAADRKTPLSWSMTSAKKGKGCAVYLGTDATAVAKATKGSPECLGVLKSGQGTPQLKPGTTYYWRVDSGSAKGKVWSFKTYDGLLVDLDASKLANGNVDTWKNDGTAGGKFAKGSYGNLVAPEVVVVDGRKGIDFTGRKCLVSSFVAPKELTGNGAFTISMWAYNPVLDNDEIMVAWGKDSGSARVSYGWESPAFRNGKDNEVEYGGDTIKVEDHETTVPMVTYWNNITITYANGTMKVYVNGILHNQKQVNLRIADGGKISLGAVINDIGDRNIPFSGQLSDISMYGYALSADEVAALPEGKPADASKMLVNLDSDKLKDGILASWKNEGTLGGEFILPENKVTVPVVADVAGRKAVTFDGRYSFLQSDIKTPAGVTGIKPVTVEMWVNNERVTGGETVFSLAPREAFARVYFEGYILRALEMRYAPGGARNAGALNTGWDVRNLGWKDGKFPEPGKWHHIAFVYDGKHQGVGRVYVDGNLENEVGYYTICTNGGLPMFLGTAWNTDYGTQDMFSGALASLKVYDYARTAEEIKKAAQSN